MVENSHQEKEKLQQTLETVNLGHEERHRKHLTPHGNMTPEKTGPVYRYCCGAKLGFQKIQGSFLVNVRELH